jgi:hypothetical protein
VAVGSGGPSEEGSTGLQNFILFHRFYRYRFNVLRFSVFSVSRILSYSICLTGLRFLIKKPLKVCDARRLTSVFLNPGLLA